MLFQAFDSLPRNKMYRHDVEESWSNIDRPDGAADGDLGGRKAGSKGCMKLSQTLLSGWLSDFGASHIVILAGHQDLAPTPLFPNLSFRVRESQCHLEGILAKRRLTDTPSYLEAHALRRDEA